MLYSLLKICVSVFFNMLNRILGGKLPPFGTACTIVEEHDYYLVVKLPGDHIVFPGGFMNWRETPEEAATRETLEETGLHVQIDDFLEYHSAQSNRWSNMSNICFIFSAHVTGGTLRNNIEGRPAWLHESELRRCMDQHSQRALDTYLNHRATRRTYLETIKTGTLTPLAS